MSTIDEIIIRLRSDAEFSEAVRTDPQAALAEYDIGDEVRAAFANPDVLALWTAVTSAQVTWASFPVAIHSGPRPVPPTPPTPPTPPAPPAPPVPPEPPVVPEPPVPPVATVWATGSRRS